MEYLYIQPLSGRSCISLLPGVPIPPPFGESLPYPGAEYIFAVREAGECFFELAEKKALHSATEQKRIPQRADRAGNAACHAGLSIRGFLCCSASRRACDFSTQKASPAQNLSCAEDAFYDPVSRLSETCGQQKKTRCLSDPVRRDEGRVPPPHIFRTYDLSIASPLVSPSLTVQ